MPIPAAPGTMVADNADERILSVALAGIEIAQSAAYPAPIKSRQLTDAPFSQLAPAQQRCFLARQVAWGSAAGSRGMSSPARRPTQSPADDAGPIANVIQLHSPDFFGMSVRWRNRCFTLKWADGGPDQARTFCWNPSVSYRSDNNPSLTHTFPLFRPRQSPIFTRSRFAESATL